MAEQEDELMTPAELAELFRVDPQTIRRWSDEGKLDYVKTPGGHRRYWKSYVRRLLEEGYVGGNA